MLDFGESDKMIKLSGKVDKLDSYNRFRNISFFIHRNITKPEVSVWFIQPWYMHTHPYICKKSYWKRRTENIENILHCINIVSLKRHQYRDYV